MRFFELLNFQHAVAYLFPTILFMVVFGLGLSFAHLRAKDSERRKEEVVGRFAENLSDRDAPFPLVMMLIVAGTFVWGFFYIVMHGLPGVNI